MIGGLPNKRSPLMLKNFVSTFLLLIALFLGCANARASSGYLIGQAYFEDTTNSLTLANVKQEKFTPYDGWLTKGYRPSTYWIRLDIHPSNQDLILRIRPAYIENIQIFDPSSADEERVTGSKYRASEADVQAYNHNFILGADNSERQVYLKVKSARTYLLNFEVFTLSEFLSAEHTSSLIFVAYIVFILSLALGLMGAWFSSREAVLGMFVIQQFISFLYTVFLYGYARAFFDPYIDQSIVNYSTYILVMAYVLTGILANKFLLEEYSLKRLYRYLFNGAICTSVIIFTLLILGYPGTALKINASLVMLSSALFFLTALFGTRASKTSINSNLSINMLRLFYLFNLIMWGLVALPALGVTPSNEIAAHSNLLYSVLSGLIFFWLLQSRAKSILKNEVLKSTALKKEVENERLRREEQGKLMSMLTHEIRTPLSVLKLVVDRKVAGSDVEDFANRAVSNIDSIIDKCIQLDQLDSNVLQINKVKFNFLVLLNSMIFDTRLENRFSIQGQADIDIETDLDILSIIVSNLLGNAIKYSAPETKIEIFAEILADQYPKRLQFSVQNEIGSMGTPDPALAFEKYYRSPSAAKVSGTGLGLFLVRELVHALNGDVKLTIKDNLIIFTVWIPI